MNQYPKILRRENSIGMRFEKLVVTGISEKYGLVKCICDCGTVCEKMLANMKRATCKSCGCLGGERHQKSGDPAWRKTYASWSHMKLRCSNPNELYFHNYGGRGIKVCDRWNNSFSAFVSDMGKRPDGCTLDRLDVNGMYSPDNCRWATKLEQDNNRRRTTWVFVNGSKMSFMDAWRLLGFSYWKEYNQIRKKKKSPQQCVDDFLQSKQISK